MQITPAFLQKAAADTGAQRILETLTPQEKSAAIDICSQTMDKIIGDKFEELLSQDREVDSTSYLVARIILATHIADALAKTAEQMIHQNVLPENPRAADLLIKGLFPVQRGNNN